MNILTICGYIGKESFFKKSEYFEKGAYRYRDDGTYFINRAPLYEIKQSDLMPVNRIHDLLII